MKNLTGKFKSLYATRNCVVDYANLEVQLNQYKDMLNNEKQSHKNNLEKLKKVEKNIYECESIVEDNKFLFCNKESHNNDNVNLNDNIDINLPTFSEKDDTSNEKDDHSYSLLQLLRQKYEKCIKKFDSKQKEFEKLQKDIQYTELNELFVDITELKAEIERIEKNADNIITELYANVKFNKKKYERPTEKRNQELNIKNKSRVKFYDNAEENLSNRSNDRVTNSDSDNQKNEFKSLNQSVTSSEKKKKRQSSYSGHKNRKKLSPNKKNEYDYEEYDKKRIFLINHIIIEHLYQLNQQAYWDNECLGNNNKDIHALNTDIENKISIKKKILNKSNTERNKKLAALASIQDKNNQHRFYECEEELNKNLK